MKQAKIMYTLGQIAAAIWTNNTGLPRGLTDILLTRPASGLAMALKTPQGKAAMAASAVDSLIGRLPADFADPPNGVSVEDQGPFWFGYYHYRKAQHDNHALGPAALAAAGEALFGDRWQTDLARELGISDARRVREWMSGERRIPTGVWADLRALLRDRGMAALSLSAAMQWDGEPESSAE